MARLYSTRLLAFPGPRAKCIKPCASTSFSGTLGATCFRRVRSRCACWRLHIIEILPSISPPAEQYAAIASFVGSAVVREFTITSSSWVIPIFDKIMASMPATACRRSIPADTALRALQVACGRSSTSIGTKNRSNGRGTRPLPGVRQGFECAVRIVHAYGGQMALRRCAGPQTKRVQSESVYVEAIEHHHLVPNSDEISHKALMTVAACIHIDDRTQLRV